METRKTLELKINPLNPRGEIVIDDTLRELAFSIKSQGVLQPVVITPENVIVAGHRRLAAAKLAKVPEIPVVVKSLTEAEQLQVMLVENLQRQDLSLLQTAKAYHLLTQYGLKVTEIANAVGVMCKRITQLMEILKLDEGAQGCFDGEGAMSLGAVPVLLRLAEDQQVRISKMAVEQRWSLATITRTVNAIQESKVKRVRSNPKAIDYMTLAGRIEREYDLVKNDPRLRVVAALLRQAVEGLYDLREREVKSARSA